jgi:hypothetical protein
MATGILPILLMQIALRSVRLDSFYSLLLSTATFILASVSAKKLVTNDALLIYQVFNRQNLIPECGNNTTPRTFCLDESKYDIIRPKNFSPFIPILVFLWISKLGKQATYWFHAHSKGQSDPPEEDPPEEDPNPLWLWIMVPAEIFFFAEEIYLVVSIINNLIPVSANGGNSAANLMTMMYVVTPSLPWGIGQVIAVLVWAPTLAKYLYLVTGMSLSLLYCL